MRANEFLTEGAGNYSQLAQLIYQNCQPFLELTRGYNGRLYRGVDYGTHMDVMSSPGIKIPVKKDRLPLNTSITAHTTIDNFFDEKFGIRFRSGAVFASGSKTFAKQFGGVVIIFPVGKFDYCWSPKVKDLTYNLIPGEDLELFHGASEAKSIITNALDNADYRCNAGAADFVAAIRSRNEVMINCDHYLAIPDEMYPAIMRHIEKLQTTVTGTTTQ